VTDIFCSENCPRGVSLLIRRVRIVYKAQVWCWGSSWALEYRT